MTGLVPLPRQPDGVPWPTDAWPVRDDGPPELAALVEEMFTDTGRYAQTYAVVVVHRGAVVAERYGGALPKWNDPDEPVTIDTPLLSWSMAKSILHAAVGILVDREALALDEPAAIAEWQRPGDPRQAITLEHLLEMRDGLAFDEDYIDGETSHVIDMLFGAGSDDVAAFAAARPLANEPGSTFNYSSGTSNLVARLAGEAIGGDAEGVAAWLHDELFAPIGMATATARFDAAGTFVGSSYVHATARDFARFGLLQLRGGEWDGRRVLPAGWVDHGRTLRSIDPSDGSGYGAHWWVVAGDPLGSFWASGYEGQSILCVPALDLLVVRLGRTDASLGPNLRSWRDRVTDAFVDLG